MGTETLIGTAVVALVLLVAALVAVATVKALIVIVPPNRAAVITGRNRQLTSGQRIGYRSVIGGRKTVVFVLLVIVMATLTGMIYGNLF